MIRSFYSLLILTAFLSQINAQSFTNRNDLFESPHYSGVAIGIADMNADGLDDIIRLSQGTDLNIVYQTSTDSLTVVDFFPVDEQSQWMMAVGDVDNNGYNDLMAGDRDFSKLALANEDGSSYTLSTFNEQDFFAQTGNFADINNDGMLDAFICDDNAESKIYANMGAGTFENADYMIDMSTNPVSDKSGNYGSIWTDYDNDWDVDLYIAKCRQGVNDPTDGRRINQLFQNDGENNFSEKAEEAGLRIGWQSWTADFQDIDNDGDLDCFITNHDYISQLLENDGAGNFTDISVGSGLVVQGTPIQGVMRDFDNDGFVDVLVSGSRQHLFRNNGDKTFTEVDVFDTNDMESYAIGDLNSDGFLDIYAGYADIYTTPSNTEDVLWMNDGNDNNYLQVRLQGTESNSFGVGARIEIHGDFGIQIREVRAGESYGISNAHMQHFGLGQTSTIDHVVVKWPSGNISVLDDVAANQIIDIPESTCTPEQIVIQEILCPGESITVNAQPGPVNGFIWSNGVTDPTQIISTATNLSSISMDGQGCWVYFRFEVSFSPDETPTVTVDGDLEFCEGGTVTLTSSEANSYAWTGGLATQSITVDEPGNYSVSIQGECATFTSESFTVQVLENASLPTAENIVIPEAGPVSLIATGVNPYWYDMQTDGQLLGIGTEVELNVTENTTFYVADVNLYGGEMYNAGLINQLGSNLYSGPNFNGAMIFDVNTIVNLSSVKVYTDTPGERIIELTNANGQVMESVAVNIPIGESRIDLNFTIEPGLGYTLTTNEDQNNFVLGTDAPRLQRSSSGVNYPYTIEDVISIESSNGNSGGVQRWYYFYDWEIMLPSKECASERIPVQVTIDPSVSVSDPSFKGAVKVYPNPAVESFFVNVSMENAEEVEYSVYDGLGKLIEQKSLGVIGNNHQVEIITKEYAKGIYLLKVKAGNATHSERIIIQ